MNEKEYFGLDHEELSFIARNSLALLITVIVVYFGFKKYNRLRNEAAIERATGQTGEDFNVDWCRPGNEYHEVRKETNGQNK